MKKFLRIFLICLILPLIFGLVNTNPGCIIPELISNVKGNPTAINNALRKGGNSTSAGYIWRYKN